MRALKRFLASVMLAFFIRAIIALSFQLFNSYGSNTTDARSSAFCLPIRLRAEGRGQVDTDARFGSSINDRLITAGTAPTDTRGIRIPF
jgi:hypothetical protein